MDSLERLRQIGVKKINQDTKISVSAIENILEKRFDKIQRVWVVGFLTILQREYQVDLSCWLEEYDAFLLQNAKADSEIYKIKELELDTQDQKYEGFRTNLSKGILKQIILAILGICIFVVIFMLVKIFAFSDNVGGDYSIVEAPMQKHQEQHDIYAHLQQNLDNHQEPKKQILEEEIEVKDGEVLIIPKRELWFQVLNLQTKAKQDKTISEPFLLKLPSTTSVFIFGHKGFDLKYKDRIQKFNGGGSIRFVLEDQQLKYVKYTDYLKLLGIEEKKPKEDKTLQETTIQNKQEQELNDDALNPQVDALKDSKEFDQKILMQKSSEDAQGNAQNYDIQEN